MMKHLLLLLLFLPTLVLAKVEMFQIVVFDWDEDKNILSLVSMGSGTAVGSDLILTNKHVVETSDNDFADLLILCQASQKAGNSVSCDMAAGVAAVHPDEDIALVRPLGKAFFPQVRVSHKVKRAGDPVRVFGFPIPNQDKFGFGDNRTLTAFTTWLEDPSTPLNVSAGDKLTVTRGQVQARLQNTDTGFTYTLTDAKVDFGNSGGAIFDEYGDYLGIVTFKDQSGNSIFLEYHQIDDWIRSYGHRNPSFSEDAYKFYQGISNPQAPSTKTETKPTGPLTLAERIRAMKARKATSSQTSSPAKSSQNLSTSKKRLLEHLRARYQRHR